MSNPRTCANIFLSPRDKGKSEEEREKAVEDDGEDTNCLFIWNIFSRRKKVEEKNVVSTSVL